MKIYDMRNPKEIPFENLNENDALYVYLSYPMVVADIQIEMEINIVAVIRHAKQASVYYGFNVVEEVIWGGTKIHDPKAIENLFPELHEAGYTLYL